MTENLRFVDISTLTQEIVLTATLLQRKVLNSISCILEWKVLRSILHLSFSHHVERSVGE